jgi:hypothetical protein
MSTIQARLIALKLVKLTVSLRQCFSSISLSSSQDSSVQLKATLIRAMNLCASNCVSYSVRSYSTGTLTDGQEISLPYLS